MTFALVSVGFLVVAIMLVLAIVTTIGRLRRGEVAAWPTPKHKQEPSRDASRDRALPGKARIKARRSRTW